MPQRPKRPNRARGEKSTLWLVFLWSGFFGVLAAVWRAIIAPSGPFSIRTWFHICVDVARARLAAPSWNVRPLEQVTERAVAIVTGGNSGIGFETARGLWLAGYNVILACRSENRGQEACKQILETEMHPSASAKRGTLTVLPLDLSELSSVVAFVERYHQRWKTLDLLVLNAGIMSPFRYEETAQGYEAHLGVNHLAQYLLVRLLMDMLEQRRGRVVLVSSILALLADDLSWHGPQWSRQGQWPFMAYGWSKAYNYMLSLELQRRGLDARCVHPGEVRTEVVRRLPSWVQRAYTWIGSFVLRTPAEGAATVLFACFAPLAGDADERAVSTPSKSARTPSGNQSEQEVTALTVAQREALILDAGSRFLAMPLWMRAPANTQQLWMLSEHAVEPYLRTSTGS
jgi:NAD(P)-dependent dehydrogenase (short-subunit alcohol dehydrogenase family)